MSNNEIISFDHSNAPGEKNKENKMSLFRKQEKSERNIQKFHIEIKKYIIKQKIHNLKVIFKSLITF